MNEIPAAKIRMMQASMNCLVFGMLALIPIIGVPFGLTALWMSYFAHRCERQFWNPGKPYRVTGQLFAAVGVLVWTIVDTIWIYKIANPGG